MIIFHWVLQLNDNILKQIDKWPAYLGLLQRFARLNPAAVGRKVAQYRTSLFSFYYSLCSGNFVWHPDALPSAAECGRWVSGQQLDYDQNHKSLWDPLFLKVSLLTRGKKRGRY